MNMLIFKEEVEMMCCRDEYKQNSVPVPCEVAKERAFIFRDIEILDDTKRVFNEAKKMLPGLKSANFEILHGKHDRHLYFRFQTKKAGKSSPWTNSRFRTLKLELSLKDMGAEESSFSSSEEEEAEDSQDEWQFIRGFSVQLHPMRRLYYPMGMDLYLMKKMCHVDRIEDYVYSKSKASQDWSCLKLQITMKFTKEMDIEEIVKNRDPMYSMKKMLADGKLSDFVIVSASGKKFPCHKSILAVQSDVFSAMFESNMSEANSQELRMKDMTSAGVAAFLKYLYCRDLKAAISNVRIGLELLRAGHKYHVKDLETDCKDLLDWAESGRFDAQTAFEMFEFSGNVEGLERVRENAARVFKANADKYEKSGELSAILDSENAETVAKLFKLVASL